MRRARRPSSTSRGVWGACRSAPQLHLGDLAPLTGVGRRHAPALHLLDVRRARVEVVGRRLLIALRLRRLLRGALILPEPIALVRHGLPPEEVKGALSCPQPPRPSRALLAALAGVGHAATLDLRYVLGPHIEFVDGRLLVGVRRLLLRVVTAAKAL